VADGAGGDGDWADGNANADRREKSRNRSANRGGRGGTDSRGCKLFTLLLFNTNIEYRTLHFIWPLPSILNSLKNVSII